MIRAAADRPHRSGRGSADQLIQMLNGASIAYGTVPPNRPAANASQSSRSSCSSWVPNRPDRADHQDRRSCCWPRPPLRQPRIEVALDPMVEAGTEPSRTRRLPRHRPRQVRGERVRICVQPQHGRGRQLGGQLHELIARPGLDRFRQQPVDVSVPARDDFMIIEQQRLARRVVVAAQTRRICAEPAGRPAPRPAVEPGLRGRAGQATAAEPPQSPKGCRGLAAKPRRPADPAAPLPR